MIFINDICSSSDDMEYLIRYTIVERDYIFSIFWRCYAPKRDILDYWGTIIFCLLYYYNGYGKLPL